MNEILKRINILKDKLNLWAKEYYVLDKPTVSDFEYDSALKELIKLEKENPQYITDDSPSQRVGGEVIDKFNKVRHAIPMLSLSNQFSSEDLLKFDLDIKKALDINDVKYTVEPKIDGLSISLIYQGGILKQALTRGDGEFGEDVTKNVKTIKSVPLTINTTLPHIEIRGEIFMTFSTFNKLNDSIPNEDDKFANPRNAAAGSLRNLDTSITATRNLDMIAYYIPDQLTLKQLHITTQYDVIQCLKSFGFKVAKETKLCNCIDDVINYINEIANHKDKLDFPIDGMVIKQNEIKYYDALGMTSKFPKWATAYKFPPEIVQTKLLDIQATVGRTGRITYVAKLSPVVLSSSTVSSATLHNAEYILEKDIRVGDTVEVFKAAEIIPKVIGPILSKRPSETKKFEPITRCPICNSLLEKQPTEVDQYCTNISCQARIIQSIIHFTSKKAMNIEELSERNVQKFYDANIIRSIQDIYSFASKRDLVINGDFKVKEKMFNKIVNNIESSKKNSLEKLIFAIGIRHIGETTAKILAKKYRSINNLAKASIEELREINDIGETVAISIFDFFKNVENTKLIEHLISQGVNVEYVSSVDQSQMDINSPYYQKSFVITGSFDIPRHEIKKKLEEKFDANVLDAISKSIDYLIVGEDGGSKIQKAEKLNISIIRDKIWEK